MFLQCARGLLGFCLCSGITMKKTIVLLPGDGIGPEVTLAAAAILRESAQEFNHQFEFAELPIGGAGIDGAGRALSNETLYACRKADAVFLGAVGGPKWDALPVGKRPETGLLGLRKGLGLYVNLGPGKLIEPLRGIFPLGPGRRGVYPESKATVLTCPHWWRQGVASEGAFYTAVKLEHMYVDNAAMQLTL